MALLAGKSHSGLSRLAAFCSIACLLFLRAGNASGAINPGAVWLDDRGQQIQAHGGGILKVGDTFFWFGEDRTQGLDPNKRCVSCYASKDLEHWTFRNQVLKLSDPENFGPGWLIERPKVFYNAATKKVASTPTSTAHLQTRPRRYRHQRHSRRRLPLPQEFSPPRSREPRHRPVRRRRRHRQSHLREPPHQRLRHRPPLPRHLNVEKQMSFVPLH